MKSPDSLPPEDWLAGIFAGSHVAIGLSRLTDGRFVAVNDAFERLFGHKRKDILDHTALELGLWPFPEERDSLMAMLHEGQPVRAFESRYRMRSGAIGNLLVSASIVSLGGEQYMVGQLTDVTERKHAERAMKTNEARLATVLKLSELAVFHQDRKLRYTWFANPALGLTVDRTIAHTDDELFGRQAAKPLTAIKRRVLRNGRGERQEVWLTHGDHTGCFDLIVEPEHGPDGHITGVVCAATDITRRKLTEQHLQLQADILATLEEGVNLVDAEGIIRYTNPSFDAMFGYAVGELLGRHAAILNAPGEATPEQAAQEILRTLRRDRHWSGELRSRRKDGSEFWTRANVIAARHPSVGEVWVSAQSDITALRQAREERDLAHRVLTRLADHMQDEIEIQRRELAREVHDEIGATLTGIRMRLDSLALREYCGEVADIRALLDQALDTTRALCSRLRPPMLDDLGLAETLRWYVRDWSRQTGIRASARIAVLMEEPADPLRIDLFRMLQELLTNVARHSGARKVRVALTTSRGTLQLRVSDDGGGITPGRAEGFGLLGIRERLRRYGGTLRLGSAGGTTITLRIPEATP